MSVFGTFIFLIIALFIVLPIVISVILRGRNRHVENDDAFHQAGVIVDYKSGVIDIKGHVYPVKDVERVSSLSGMGRNGNQSHATIAVRDMNNPIHTIKFVTPNAAAQFQQRLTMAIEKAGGPSFTKG